MKIVLKVFQWDDDLAIELPKELVDRLALKEGDEIEIVKAFTPKGESKEPQD